MSDALLVSTRKGLFTVVRQRGQWQIAKVDFLGDNVTLTLTDPRDGRSYAALDHGHFGVKLHRSADGGRTWERTWRYTNDQRPFWLARFWPSIRFWCTVSLGKMSRSDAAARSKS